MMPDKNVSANAYQPGLVLLTVALSLAYALASTLALTMLSPVYASLVFSPSVGIALGATLHYGYRAIPSIFIGHLLLLINPLNPVSVQSFSLIFSLWMATASAAATGVALGYFLIKKVLKGKELNITSPQHLLRILLFGGPAAFLLPSLLVNFHYIDQGIIGAEFLTGNTLVWWFARCAGVMILTPATYFLLLKPGRAPYIEKLTIGLSVLTALLIICYTFLYFTEKDTRQLHSVLHAETKNYALQINSELKHHMKVTRYIRNSIYEYDHLDSNIFNKITRPLLQQHENIASLIWAAPVKQADRAEFERHMQATFNEDFQITAIGPEGNFIPSPNSEEYLPLVHIETGSGNTTGHGVDYLSLAVEKHIFDSARRTAQPSLTVSPFVPDTSPGNSTILSTLPVFWQDSENSSSNSRPGAIRGYVVTYFYLSKIMEKILRPNILPGLNLLITDKTDGNKRVLFHAVAKTPTLKRTTSVSYAIDFYNLHWQVLATPSRKLLAAHYSWNNRFLFLGGILFTSLISAALIIMFGRRAEIEKQVKLRSREILESQEQLRILATAFDSHEAIVITNQTADILQVNEAYSRVTGYSAAELLGKNIYEITTENDTKMLHAAGGATEQVTYQGFYSGEIAMHRKDGTAYTARMKITAIEDEQGIKHRFVSVFSDITEEKATEEKIHRLAFYDPLTALPNRRLIIDRIEHELSSAKRYGQRGAVLFIDIDNFKAINDSLGHDHGDQLLMAIGQRLIAQVRLVDTVARLGGDEFILLLQSEVCTEEQAINNASTVSKKVLALGDAPYQIGDHRHYVTLSIGATLFPANANSHQELLKQADTALYRAKALGKNTCCFFHADMQRLAEHHLAMERDLREGLKLQQFLLHYQPQVDREGKLISVEALARWQHPVRGMVSPAEFIPIAEESGLILPLGEWVMQEACSQMRQLLDEGFSISHVSVNVSERQFRQKNFVAQVEQILQACKLPARHLMLELTESVVVKDIIDTQKTMDALSNLGVQLSMDDFGTGYSSLSYLSKLPFDELKIDQSFIRNLFVDKRNAAIVTTIISMAENLQLTVLAEGVEEQEQLDYLKRHGCEFFQGYLFSKPLTTALLKDFPGKQG